MVAITYLCLITVSYILDSMKCAEALTRAEYDPAAHGHRPEFLVSARKFELVELVERFLVRAAACRGRVGCIRGTIVGVCTRRADVVCGAAVVCVCVCVCDACGLPQGKRAKQIYIIIIILYLWGATWSYMVVFAASFASHVPISFISGGTTCEVGPDCTAQYHFWGAVFAVVGLLLTCLNLKEQAIMQITMTALRFVLIFLVRSGRPLTCRHCVVSHPLHMYPRLVCTDGVDDTVGVHKRRGAVPWH